MKINLQKFWVIFWGVVCFSAVFGAYIGIGNIDIGANIFLYRIMIILFVILTIFLLINRKIHLFKIKQLYIKNSIDFFIFWMGYSLLSCLWAKDKVSAVKYNIFIFSLCFLIIFTVHVSYNQKIWSYIVSVMLLTIIITIVIGMWENITGRHLHYYTFTFLGDKRPATVFSNINDFATFLGLYIMIIIAVLRITKSYIIKIFMAALVILSLYLIYETGSRANLIGIICTFIVYIFINLKNRKILTYTILSFNMIVIAMVIYWDIIYKMLESMQVKLVDESVRLELIINSIKVGIDSFLLGVGSGNAGIEISKKLGISAQIPDVSIHNFWIEIFATYGVVVFGFFIFIIITIVIKLAKLVRYSDKKYVKIMAMSLLSSFPEMFIGGMSPSSLLSMRFVWIYLGLAIAFLRINDTGTIKIVEQNIS